MSLARVPPRRAAIALLVVAILIGTVSDTAPVRTPPRVGGYWLLAGDFHVHAFPGDGGLPAWLFPHEARRAGLDIIAVTNHPNTLAAHIARWAADLVGGPIVLTGQEVTTPRYHLVAIDIDRTVPADPSAVHSIADVHAQGGLAIAAHPLARISDYDAAAIGALDAVEVVDPSPESVNRLDIDAFFTRVRRLRGRAAPLGSSDVHLSPQLGSNRTWIFADEPTAAGAIAAIRRGTTVAEDRLGRVTGDAALIGLMRSTNPVRRVDPHPIFRWLAVGLAWIGVLGVLVLRRPGEAGEKF